jgi:hypothetical protein
MLNLKPVHGGVDGNLHFPVPFMNRLNQTELATFSILSCWAFLRILYLSISVIKNNDLLATVNFNQIIIPILSISQCN